MTTKSQIEPKLFSEILLPSGETLNDAMVKLRVAAEQKGLRMVFLVVDNDHRLCISGHTGNDAETVDLLATFAKWIAGGGATAERPKLNDLSKFE
jgi:hypothetical protein